MKGFMMGTGLGVVATSVVATVISLGVVNSTKKKIVKEKDKLEKDLASRIEECDRVKDACSKVNDKVRELQNLIDSNKDLTEQNKKDKKEIEKDKVNIRLEKQKISDAKKTILDGVDALKSAMYCNDIMTRDSLVEKNCRQIMTTVQRIDREMEFYKKFAGYGKDFAWVEGNVEAISKRLEDNPGDLETTMQLLGYEEREKQILRWCFAS